MLQKMLQERDFKIKKYAEEIEYLNNVIQSERDRFSAKIEMLKSELVCTGRFYILSEILIVVSLEI